MTPDPDKIQSVQVGELDAWRERLAGLARDVDRVADRLRGLSQARLAASAPPHPSRAAAARATAQTFADAAAGLEARQHPAAPGWRTLPELGDFGVGDQLAVTGHDLVAAADRAAPGDRAWARHGRRTADDLLADAAAALDALRRIL